MNSTRNHHRHHHALEAIENIYHIESRKIKSVVFKASRAFYLAMAGGSAFFSLSDFSLFFSSFSIHRLFFHNVVVVILCWKTIFLNRAKTHS